MTNNKKHTRQNQKKLVQKHRKPPQKTTLQKPQ